jgi:hypothetical protein
MLIPIHIEGMPNKRNQTGALNTKRHFQSTKQVMGKDDIGQEPSPSSSMLLMIGRQKMLRLEDYSYCLVLNFVCCFPCNMN